MQIANGIRRIPKSGDFVHTVGRKFLSFVYGHFRCFTLTQSRLVLLASCCAYLATLPYRVTRGHDCCLPALNVSMIMQKNISNSLFSFAPSIRPCCCPTKPSWMWLRTTITERHLALPQSQRLSNWGIISLQIPCHANSLLGQSPQSTHKLNIFNWANWLSR